jgi:hypothetical protein
MMAKQPKPSDPSRDVSRRKGPHHGWAQDVDETHQEENPSAHRSFHPDEYAPEPGPGREISKEETEGVPADRSKSTGGRGEDQAKKSRKDGMHDTGPRGRSQRPSGTRDASAVTGVDPQDPKKRSD